MRLTSSGKGTEAMLAKKINFDDPGDEPTTKQSSHRTQLCDLIEPRHEDRLSHHAMSTLRLSGFGQSWNLPSAPMMYLAAALPATRPKTTQSKSELPPRRLLPWTPPAISPAAYNPGITPSLLITSASAVTSRPPMQ